MINRRNFDLERFPSPDQFRLDSAMPQMSFTDTLGKAEWELIAVYCIYKAQQAGWWIAVKLKTNSIIAEMITAGLLVFSGRVGRFWWKSDTYLLTRKALDYIQNPSTWQD